MNDKTYSLYAVIVAVIVLSVCAVMAVHVSVSYVTMKNRVVEDTRARAESTLASLQKNIAGFMESFAANEYEKLILTEMDFPDFHAIVVEDYNLGSILGMNAYVTGKIRDDAWRPIDYDRDNPNHRHVVKDCVQKSIQPILSSSGQQIGSVTVCVFGHSLQMALRDVVVTQGINAAAIALLLIMTLFYTLHRIVLKPVSKIARTLTMVDPDGIPRASVTVRGPREISSLSSSVNAMIEAIRNSRRELMEQHEKLREERNRFQLAVQGSQDGLWDWNPVTGEVFFSDQWQAMIGYAPGEIGNTFAEWSNRIHPDDLTRAVEAVNAHLNGETELYEVRHRMACKNGAWKWILARGKALFDDQGKPIRVVGFHTDVTREVEHQEELSEARRQAEQASQAKSEFLASMSHELRTPLNAILGFSQLLKYDPKNPLTPAQLDHVESIIMGGEHLLELVNEILDLARIEAKQEPMSLEDVDAYAVIAESVALSAPLAKSKNITIEDRGGEGSSPVLRTDRKRFKQILLNLLSNAIKYNHAGGTVTVSSEEMDQGYLRVRVSDTGRGIAPQDFNKVFHLFQRLGEDPAIAHEGTGIGLTVTKLLVERMAGRVDFESELGKGSTFWFELPLASNHEAVIWADTLRIGVDAIDKDHQGIVVLMNKASHRDIDETDMDGLVRQLLDHARQHFRREEAVMRVCHFPDLESHRAIHQDLTRQIEALETQWRQTHDLAIVNDIRELLRTLWIGHVMRDDVKISAYAEGKSHEILKALKGLA
ncbi:MAG: PAS domain-containing protein [Alphaproteobacteria bacterium]|nr:PAS domain-containing protein [Alphaproteobacteria bacterium]MBF0249100.1 PAS domain-containing protein [Alphaproteobacteria bacterium]